MSPDQPEILQPDGLTHGWLGATSAHWDERVGDGIAKAILTYLRACEGHDSGEVWPGLETIAFKTEFCLTAVKRAIGKLRKRGWVEVRREKKKHGGFKNFYRIKTTRRETTSGRETPSDHRAPDDHCTGRDAPTALGATRLRSKEGEVKKDEGRNKEPLAPAEFFEAKAREKATARANALAATPRPAPEPTAPPASWENCRVCGCAPGERHDPQRHPKPKPA